MYELDKKQVVKAILVDLEKRKAELLNSVENFRKSAGEQSKSIESWSDSSRAQFNMMGGAFKKDAKQIESAISFLKTLEGDSNGFIGTGSLAAVKEDGQEKFFFIVPEGSGGFAVEVDGKDVLVIAVASPMGSILVGKKAGETAVFSAPEKPFSDGDNRSFNIISVK